MIEARLSDPQGALGTGQVGTFGAESSKGLHQLGYLGVGVADLRL